MTNHIHLIVRASGKIGLSASSPEYFVVPVDKLKEFNNNIKANVINNDRSK